MPKLYVLDVLALAAAINELSSHTRRARTGMWCALQMSSNDVPVQCLRCTENASQMGKTSSSIDGSSTVGVPVAKPADATVAELAESKADAARKAREVAEVSFKEEPVRAQITKIEGSCETTA